MKNPVCDPCNIKFRTLPDLNMHMKNIHSESDSMRLDRLQHIVSAEVYPKRNISIMFDCSQCGIIFQTEGQFRAHNKNNCCGVSEKQMRHGEEMQNQIVQEIQCSLCQSVLKNMNEFKIHMLNVHTTKPSDRHVNTNTDTNVNKFRCKDCDLVFPRLYMLVKHKIHDHKKGSPTSDKTPIVVNMCDECNQCFTSLHEMKKHQNDDHIIVRNVDNNLEEYIVEEYPEIKENANSAYGEEEVKVIKV